MRCGGLGGVGEREGFRADKNRKTALFTEGRRC